jgi:signal transduction histidine kinase
MNALDLRPAEDIEKFLEVERNGLPSQNKHGISRHIKKNGTIIMVDLIADNIIYQGQSARLILAHDVTEKLKAEAELIRHRIMQQEIITETTILVQEKEREEIGKELHDNINQILASTKLYLELAVSANKELYPEAISKSYNNINLAIGEIRQLSKQLIKPALDTSLTDSVRDLTEEIQAITPVDIIFDASAFNEVAVDEMVKLMVYRVIQEQLNNILKYAAASKVNIELSTDDQRLCLVIRDDGIGFDMEKKSKGIGLRNIDTRVKFHKGTSIISSRPGDGCTINIEVPLKTQPVTLYS